jgi:hypothetical protein
MAKPPLGLMPKYIWDLQRKQDIKAAIDRYIAADKPIPWKWVQEYIRLTEITEPKQSALEGQVWD